MSVYMHSRVLTGQPADSPRRHVFAIVTGSHTHYLAAESLHDAKMWISAIRDTWLHCFEHTSRKTMSGPQAGGMIATQKLAAENALLRESIKELNVKVTASDSEYWRYALVSCSERPTCARHADAACLSNRSFAPSEAGNVAWLTITMCVQPYTSTLCNLL